MYAEIIILNFFYTMATPSECSERAKSFRPSSPLEILIIRTTEHARWTLVPVSNTLHNRLRIARPRLYEPFGLVPTSPVYRGCTYYKLTKKLEKISEYMY